ncbi:phospholipase D-like domain-containing protein [Sorangium cellulosum]|uniref:phospholipase D-like domain-containing protein n=1 Tax=Sorangium cellulosum TaxID=56 RepID=UPI0013EC5C63|nr:phospholipase D-like domain-containing protein [Sorangium cellulosum]
MRVPINETSLRASGLGHLVEPLRPYLRLGREGVRALVDVALAERRHRKTPRLTLVWTGDDPGVSHSRHTRVVLPELFARAREHVLIAGYSIDHGAELFASLHRVMADHGVTVELFVDVGQLAERLRHAVKGAGQSWSLVSAPLEAAQGNVERGRAVVALFYRLMWPFGDPKPVVYFDPRTAEKQSAVSLHAKCVVIDHEYTLITSANFTDRGQTRNLEAGVAIEDRGFAASLERQWWNLVDAAVVVRA